MPYAYRSPLIACLALLSAVIACGSAQAQDCTAEVKIAPVGLQKPIDDTRQPGRTVTLARYRLDATSNEKQCVVVSFNVLHSYKDKDGTVVSATDSATMRLIGGKGRDHGELPLKRSIPKLTWSVEDVSCKLCK